MVSVIVAMSRNRVIGKENKLIWHLPADLKHFKETTMGKPIIMGRKTFESVGKPLPGRTNIVITRNKDYQAPGCLMAASVKQALEMVNKGKADPGTSKDTTEQSELNRSHLEEAKEHPEINMSTSEDTKYQSERNPDPSKDPKEQPEIKPGPSKGNEVFIAGGGEIYKQAMPLADRMYITIIDHDFDGDTFFPRFSATDWMLSEEIYHPADEKNKYPMLFRTYERK